MVISGFLVSCLLIGFIIVLLYIKKDSTIKSIRESEEIIKHKDNSFSKYTNMEGDWK